ncbi:MAG: NADH-quinone oxidoreductase subunit N [Verrucomicrobia bacterium]|nr:NADH-quinone oxidoreductase subunit N [Verrucomicrobiota bacterium]
MNYSLISLEIAVALLGLGVLLLDLWIPAERRRSLGYLAAAGLTGILLFSLNLSATEAQFAFGKMYVLDALALFFKRFFLVAAILVLILSVEFSDRFQAGVSEYFSLICFALLGMMFAASANDFALLFVSIELIAITFYILTSFLRGRQNSLEAGVKYLLLGGAASAFMVFGIALVFGSAGSMGFGEVAAKLKASHELAHAPILLVGVLMILVGLGFKIAAFPFQIWAPDVYQGSPAPTTAFLAVGSKAAGIVLLLRVLFTAFPEVVSHWPGLLMGLAAVTILYGSLCAIPQRNLKRLMGYSSIANAGYLLLGFAALSHAGSAAVLYYLAGYLFTVLAAFAVICVVMKQTEAEDISSLAGLGQRSPLLAATLTMAMVSLAGVPPLAGFVGKFLLLKAVIAQGAANHCYYWLTAVALVGVVISIYYYFNVVRAIYWSKDATDISPITLTGPMKAAVAVCIGGMLVLGIFPSVPLRLAEAAAKVLQLS